MKPDEFKQLVPESCRERFTGKVDFSGSCWLWTASKEKGYGRVGFNRGLWYAHRLAYLWARGDLPDGLHLDHLCRNRACVRPEHLEAVSPRVNVLRGVGACAVHARKTTCKRGHQLRAVEGGRRRRCPTCDQLTKERNRPRILARKREEYRRNRDRYIRNSREWYLKHKKTKETDIATSDQSNAA